MPVKYNLTRTERKMLAKGIAEVLQCASVYQKLPTCAYKVGIYTVDKDGAVLYPEGTNREEVLQLLSWLEEKGFHYESWDDSDTASFPDNRAGMPDTEETSGTHETEAGIAYTVEVPDEGVTDEAYQNLLNIVSSKAYVIRKALGAERLVVTRKDGRIQFPWFRLNGLDGEADAYNKLAAAILKAAKEHKRISATERNNGNDKLTMRLFLVRLGFKGSEFKAARRLLLRNLTGDSSWVCGRPSRAGNTTETGAPEETPADTVTGAQMAQEPEMPPENGKVGVPYGQQ